MEIIKANNVVYEYIRRDEEGNVEGITRAVNDVLQSFCGAGRIYCDPGT